MTAGHRSGFQAGAGQQCGSVQLELLLLDEQGNPDTLLSKVGKQLHLLSGMTVWNRVSPEASTSVGGRDLTRM